MAIIHASYMRRAAYFSAIIGSLVLAGCEPAGESAARDAHAGDVPPSTILSEADVAESDADWGTFYPYFTDDTHALKPVLVGVAKIMAGQQIHPPHRHADEEYLMVTRGRGEWYLNGETREAKEGDILFAKPWDYHGIRAAEDSPLEFVVFKYSGRHAPVPVDPNPTLPEELKE